MLYPVIPSVKDWSLEGGLFLRKVAVEEELASEVVLASGGARKL